MNNKKLTTKQINNKGEIWCRACGEYLKEQHFYEASSNPGRNNRVTNCKSCMSRIGRERRLERIAKNGIGTSSEETLFDLRFKKQWATVLYGEPHE